MTTGADGGTKKGEVDVIRTSVGVSRLDHVAIARLAGDGAWDAVDRIFTRDLHIRDGQLSHGLLLNRDGTIFADAYLGCDDEELFLLVEGPGDEALAAYLAAAMEGVDDVSLDMESTRHTIVAMDGPYAWELLSRLVGPEVIGLPYMTFFRTGGHLCYRAGKTGEFGYRLVTPRDEAEELRARLLELGEPLDAAPVGLQALDQCALENWFFNIRREGARAAGPIEMQLQWRVSYRKPFVGSEALAARRRDGVHTRLTGLIGEGALAAGDAIRFGDREIGVVANAGYAPLRSDWVGMALLDLAWAWPGIGPLQIGEGEVLARTVAPPFLRNRSLYVNPQIHAYATRNEDAFPPIHEG